MRRGVQMLFAKCYSLHAYPHVDPSLLQVSVEFLCFSPTVVEFPFIVLTSFFNKKCNRLKARVVIYKNSGC
jgi:hypothetical protein